LKKEAGIIPIQKKFLQNNFLMALAFDEGYIFGRVVRRRICMYKPYQVIDSNGTGIDISEGSHAGPYRVRDPRNTNDDVLYLDEIMDRNFPWIIHGSIGIKPNTINVYMRYPEGQDIRGRFPNIDPIVPTSGDDVGYVSGIQSPFENPTDFQEIVIPPKVHVAFEYYNKESTPEGLMSHRPVLNLMFAIYWFQPLRPNTHGLLISRIARGEVPAAFFNIGAGDKLLTYGSDYESQWGVTPLSLDEAASLGRGVF